MKMKEWKTCNANGVTAITEVVVGFDGIVVASAKAAPDFKVTREQLWKALAKAGPKPTLWTDVDPALPAEKIEVMGPPPSSGTRDAFEELVMQKGCIAAGKDKAFCKHEGAELRQDGPYVEAGENDNPIVSKLEANPQALGVFGFSYLDQNSDRLKGAVIDGIAPEFDRIASGEYPVSRKLYFYIKKAHVSAVPGIQDYATLFLSDGMSGEDGALVDKGLIPLPEADHAAMQAVVANLTEMTGKEDLE